jgi:integrase
VHTFPCESRGCRKDIGLAFSEPESRAGRRVIVVGPVVLEKLRELLNQQQLVRQFAGDRWQENDLVFPSSIGTPMEWRNMVRDFKDMLQRAGLPNIRFHDLRHTAATLMLKQGIHPKVVQKCLGHSQISLTLDTHSHVLPSMQEEAAEKLEQLLTPISISVGQSNETISNG